MFWDAVAERQGKDRMVRVMGGAGRHSSQHPVTCFVPPYAPELNPGEHLWDELREKCFHHKLFASIDAFEALEDDLEMGWLAMENTPEVIRSITKWPWIVDVLSKWK
jgi:DDE superfamily endonuclease